MKDSSANSVYLIKKRMPKKTATQVYESQNLRKTSIKFNFCAYIENEIST